MRWREKHGDMTGPEQRVATIAQGREAGVVSHYEGRQRRRICLKRANHFTSRIAWALYHQVSDVPVLDHINGDPLDNRLSNLRPVTLSQNLKNTKRPRHNKSGRIGVCWHKHGYWEAYISRNRQQVKLGRFKDLDEAIAVRERAERDPGNDYHANHGRTG